MTEPKLGEFKPKCRHFTGIQHKECEAGVHYSRFPMRTYSLPCLPDKRLHPERPLGECEKRSLMTQKELFDEYQELVRASDEAMAKIAAGKCHVCGANIEPSQIVGRCKYAACGHRIGQVAQPEDDF